MAGMIVYGNTVGWLRCLDGAPHRDGCLAMPWYVPRITTGFVTSSLCYSYPIIIITVL